eukprot:Gb_37260 [translate_table: standard]
MSQWLKRRIKSLEVKKENYNGNPCSGQGLDKLAKLISDLKAKRESLATVQTGFPTTVASFVANSHLGWMSTNGNPAKKKRWHSMKRSSKKPRQDNVHFPPGKVHVPPLDPQSVGGFSDKKCNDPQSVNEISEQNCNDPHILSEFSEKNCNNRITEDVNVIGLVDIINSILEKLTTPPRLYPLYGQLFTLILVVIMSISVVLEAKKAAVGFTAIVFFLLRVVFKRRQETVFPNKRFSLSSLISTLWLFISPCEKLSNPSQGDSLLGVEPESSKCQKSFISDAFFPNIVPYPSCSTTDTVCEDFAISLPSAETIQTSPVLSEEKIQGTKMSRSKQLRKIAFLKSASAPASSHMIKETASGAKVLSSSTCTSPELSSLSGIEQKESGNFGVYSSESNLHKESQRMKEKVLKCRHAKSCSGRVNFKESGALKMDTMGKKFGNALSSILLIIVLSGLLAGRLPALILALSWLSFVKFVEIVCQMIARHHWYGVDLYKRNS